MERLTRSQVQQYSLAKIIRDLGQPGQRVQDGLERDICRANQKIHDGYYVSGAYIPFDIAPRPQEFRRDLYTGDFVSGGALVPTDLDSSVVPLLRNQTSVLRLGARVAEGLNGDFVLPRQTSPAIPQSVAEIAPVQASQPTFDQISLRPKRISARVTFSLQLALQSSVGVERFLREDLFRQIGVYLDSMLLNGMGANSQPLGIMQTPGIGAVTFGGTASWQSILGFESDLAAQNAIVPGAKLAYLSTPATVIRWKEIAKSGVGVTSVVPIFLAEPFDWKDGSADYRTNGYRLAASNNMPNNQVLFGNFDDAVVGIWGGGLDLIADPYTSAASGEVNLTAVMFADIALQHPQSFVASSDAGNQ